VLEVLVVLLVAGETPSVLSTALERESGGRASKTYRFKVRSSLLQDVQSEDKAVTHCQGRVLHHPDLLQQHGEGAIYLPAADRLVLKDIGRRGTRDMNMRRLRLRPAVVLIVLRFDSFVVQACRSCGRSTMSRWWGRTRRPMASSMQTRK
jgi:hypothetical protein